MTKKTKAGKKSAAKKSTAKGKSNATALELIDGLDSKHESLQPVLRRLAAGEKVSDKDLDALDDSDSRVSQVTPILRDIRDGKVGPAAVAAIEALDSFGAGLQPALFALVSPSKWS